MMFEIFTNRARKVIELGRSEAKNNREDCVGTHHILIGLVEEGSGIAHHILKNNGVSVKMIRDESKTLWQEGSGVEKEPPFTPRAKKIFEQAIDEATKLGHNYVGTEHILLGLFKVECAATHILTNFGLNVEQLRREILTLLGFYEREYRFKPLIIEGEKIQSIIIVEGSKEDVIGRYDENTDELFFNVPLSIDEIQRIIRVLKGGQHDKKRI